MLSNRNLKKSRLSMVKLIFTCTCFIIFFFLKFVFWLHGYNTDLNCGFLSSLFMIMASNMGPSRTTNSIMRWIRISRFLWRDQKPIRNLFTGKNPQFHLLFSIDWDLNLWIFAQKLEFFFLLRKKNGWFKIFQLN